jgi:Pyridoxamine 5'-phosphate oxidase
MRKDIPLDELGDWLALPLVAVLATYRKDGNVLLSPVWHRFRDGGFDVVFFPGSLKVRHITNDPRASLLLYDHAPPLRGLELRTEAVLTDIEGTEIIRDMAHRYLGEEAGNKYADSVGNEFVLCRLEPGNLRTWDFEGDF